MEISPASLRNIIAKVNPNYQLLTTKSLTGGMSASVTLLEVINQHEDIQRCLLRYHDDTPHADYNHIVQREYAIQKHLATSAVPVAKSLLLDTSSEIIDPAYIILDYVEGEAIYALPDTSNFLEQYVNTLVAIHRIPVDESLRNLLPNRTDAYHAIIVHHPDTLDASLNEERIRDSLRQHWQWHINPPVLLHGDYWLGNLIWKDYQIQAVVDWEDAALGDPLIDLAYSRLEMLFAFGQDAMHEITQLYQERMPHLNYDALPYWDLCSALRPMHVIDEWGAGWVNFGRPDVTGETMRANHQWYVDTAIAKL